MKKFQAFLLALLVSLSFSTRDGYAQAQGDLLWDVVYSNVGSLESIAHADNGTFVHISRANAPSTTVLLHYVDDAGTLLSTATFEGAGDVKVEKIIEYPDGGHVITGETGETVSGTGAVWVVRVDASGTVLWEREWDPAGMDNKGKGLAVDTGGNVIVTGYVNDSLSDADVFLWKLSGAGLTIFRQTYGGAGTDVGEDVIATTDGGYLVAGRTYSYGAGDQDCWMVKTDADGLTQWTQTYGTAGYEMASDALELADGYILGARNGPYGESDGVLIKIDLSGKTVWATTVGPGVGWNAFNEVMLSENGNIGFCGFVQGPASNWGFWIGETDMSGTLVWNSDFIVGGFLQTSTAVDFRQIPGGDYMVCGQGQAAGWLMRIFNSPTDFTVGCKYTVSPLSGTLPFQTTHQLALVNNLTGGAAFTRRIAAEIDVTTGNGTSYNSWRSGYTNVSPSSNYFTQFPINLPNLGSLFGDNTFTLTAVDVTPAPYNQPPYPASGDSCTQVNVVTAVAP